MIMSANVASPIDLNEFARRAALKMEEHDFHGFEPVVLAVVEEMLAVGDGQKVEDERAAFEADFICRWKAQNPKAFAGSEDVQASIFEILLKRRDDGEYENLVPREAWFSWQSSANRLAQTEPQPAPTQQILDLILEQCRYWHGRDEARRGGFACLYAAAKEIADKATPVAQDKKPELWAVHAQGPDDLYPAFSREDAEQHAAALNSLSVPDGVQVAAVVVPSPWSPAEHWKYAAEQEREARDALRAAALISDKERAELSRYRSGVAKGLLVAAKPKTEESAVADVAHWEKSLVDMWPADEDDEQGDWHIGTIADDGYRLPVVTVEASQYDAPGDSEKIARALVTLWAQAFAGGLCDMGRAELNDYRRRLAKGFAVDEGWRQVPVVATGAMLEEFDSIIDHGAEDSHDAWSRLLNAAPIPLTAPLRRTAISKADHLAGEVGYCEFLQPTAFGTALFAVPAQGELLDVVDKAEQFIAGFEGDEEQEGVDRLPARLRAEVSVLGGRDE
jgi:hypothetical protein